MLHIITDSSADIPTTLIEHYNIHVVPLTLHINEQEYEEGVDITPQTFYQLMFASQELPKTSQPGPLRFAGVFKQFIGTGSTLCFTVSSKLSGSYQSACLGKELSGNAQVTVFDTLAGSIGHGLQVLKAAEMAMNDISLDKITAILTSYRQEMKFLILLDTLENIVKGGRLSRFQGSLAKLLNIKVILHNVDGNAEILEKLRGHQHALQRLIELIGERCADFSDRTIGITHVDNIKDASYLAGEIQKRYRPKNILINEMGSVIATYAGKAGLIVAF
ncbi:DegV family protein [Desulfitobacterium sp. Sab5]|uniref:DegV family protein n=1 Tax=Desulfitobacterium nosdiversum TaxID=3375356 RepID=UPI003CF26834